MTKQTPHNDKDINVRQPLTDIERQMVDVYLTCHNATRTAEVIGRSRTWVKARLNLDYIKQEIDTRQQDNANRADITNEWLLNEIKETALLAKKDMSWGAALKGFETLAKINGMFDETKNNGIQYNVMGSVIIAPNKESAQKLLDNPNKDIEGDYEVLNFEIGEDVKHEQT